MSLTPILRQMRALYTAKGWRSPDGQCELSNDLYVLAYRPTGQAAPAVPYYLPIMRVHE
jgi:hypothetical protein